MFGNQALHMLSICRVLTYYLGYMTLFIIDRVLLLAAKQEQMKAS